MDNHVHTRVNSVRVHSNLNRKRVLRKTVSFDTKNQETFRRNSKNRSSIKSFVYRGTGTVLKYMELETVGTIKQALSGAPTLH